MQALVSILTAALLFIHAIFGCCWHHTHACEQVATVAEATHCCHHHQQHSDSSPFEKPCKCKVECEGTCTYVLTQKVKVEPPQTITIDLLAVLPSLADGQMEALPSWRAGWPPPDLVRPLRTHLLHQVLLN